MNNRFPEKVLDLAIQIQQIPAPTFNEQSRAAFVHQRFQLEGLQTEIDEVGNVYACLPGRGEASPVVVVAHMDTVFPETVDLTVTRYPDRICAPGIGDNSLGVAGLFGLIWRTRQNHGEFPGDIWLVADVCEEGLGDLHGMRAVVGRFMENISAYIIVEGMALGQIYHRGLGIRRYRVQAQTPGGHSWTDYGSPSAIHELAALIHRLTTDIKIPANPRTSINVGVISGGVSVNTIANSAQFELDIRSEQQKTLDDLVSQVLDIIKAANRQNVTITAELIGSRPSGELPRNHPLVQAAADALQNQGVTPQFHFSSTDANIPLSLGLPAVGVGITHGAGAHTPGEYIWTAPVAQGLEILEDLVKQAFTLKNQ
ncbi:MAG: M20/M25/M40 family metallo-hydrolase [Anaerolineales bacterium]|nr:M20/M25/M40 family metallo-hydrolase [Anaerolineales bacterium]